MKKSRPGSICLAASSRSNSSHTSVAVRSQSQLSSLHRPRTASRLILRTLFCRPMTWLNGWRCLAVSRNSNRAEEERDSAETTPGKPSTANRIFPKAISICGSLFSATIPDTHNAALSSPYASPFFKALAPSRLAHFSRSRYSFARACGIILVKFGAKI